MMTISFTYFFLYSSFIHIFKKYQICFYNPTLTVTMYLSKQLRLSKALLIFSVQCIAGILGFFSIFLVLDSETIQKSLKLFEESEPCLHFEFAHYSEIMVFFGLSWINIHYQKNSEAP